jgi:hypothetical protein
LSLIEFFLFDSSLIDCYFVQLLFDRLLFCPTTLWYNYFIVRLLFDRMLFVRLLFERMLFVRLLFKSNTFCPNDLCPTNSTKWLTYPYKCMYWTSIDRDSFFLHMYFPTYFRGEVMSWFFEYFRQKMTIGLAISTRTASIFAQKDAHDIVYSHEK